jgi:outer membrane lipoprotein-sorting protein
VTEKIKIGKTKNQKYRRGFIFLIFGFEFIILRGFTMRTGLTLGLMGLLLALVVPGALHAEEWPAVLKDAQAKCETIHADIKDLTIVQDMVTSTQQGEITADQKIYQKGDRSRIEMTMHMPSAPGMDGMTTLVINDGQDTWMISPMTGKQKLAPEQARQQQMPRDCWGFTPANSKITGSDTLAGHQCWTVELTQDSITHKLFLDKKSLTVLGGVASEQGTTVRWQLSDFRKVAGEYEHPYKIEMFDGSQLLSTMNVKTVTANTGLPDSLFDASKEEAPQSNMEEMIKKMMMQQQSPDTGEKK